MILDPIACRILDLLDRDARLSADEIARKLRVSGDSVLYHLARLRDQGVLERCTAALDLSALGLLLFRVSIRLTGNAHLEILKRNLFKSSHLFLLVETRGEWDLIVWGAAQSLHHVQTSFAFCQEKLGSAIRSCSLDLITETIAYSRGYLVNRPGKVFGTRGKLAAASLDSIEISILQELRADARKTAVAIARDLGTTPAVVSYRIEKLERLGVISGYRIHLNAEKIGLQRFRVPLEFRGDFTECADAVRRFCESTPAVTRLEFQIGSCPAEIGLETESFSSLHDVLDKLRTLAQGNVLVKGVVLFRQTASAPRAVWDGLLANGITSRRTRNVPAS